ncbi:MAG: hypothetical protein Q9224_005625 [Gallowayella concinna]
MAEIVGITAGIITLVGTSRKVADGISKMLDLRHAPDTLLALNNEVVDLHFVIEDLAELEQRFQDTLYRVITPSFRRALERTKEVLLALERLIAFRLTKPGSDFGRSEVDRSVWLRSKAHIGRVMQDVRDCRTRLSNSLAIITASISIQSYSETRRINCQVETFMTDNARCYQELAQRLIGVRKQSNEKVPPAKTSAGPMDTATEVALAGKTSSSILPDGEALMSSVRIECLRRCPCHSACSCVCHRAQRVLSPGVLERLFGNLFLGYSGLPSLLKPCNVIACRRDSSMYLKMTYRFPQWFWSRAVSATFSAEGHGGRLGPELILRFPCIRPLDGNWGNVVQFGDIESLMHLINHKNASLHDVDSKYGMTALHWAMHQRRIDTTSTLIHSGADLAAEDGFGLTPRHCLLFDNTYYIPECFTSQRKDRLLLLRRLQAMDTSFEDDLLEEPILRNIYQGSNTYGASRKSIKAGGGIDETNALGETVLMKAIGHNDEPTGKTAAM